MQSWISRFLSVDDLWSVLGYSFIIILTRAANPAMDVALASLLASGMLAIFWLASVSVRARNRERRPNVRILVWGIVAAVSAWVAFGM